MVRLGLVGVGSHSRSLHVTSLQKIVRDTPDRARLAGVCDLNLPAARDIAQRFDGCAAYSSVDAMLASQTIDALMLIVPTPVLPGLVRQLLPHNLPLLIEKPLASTNEQARALCDAIAQSQARVMVSSNRRFAPVLTRGKALLAGRRVVRSHQTFARVGRTESDFLNGTAFHAADTIRFLLGDVVDHTLSRLQTETGPWATIRMTFESGCTGTLDILPTAGLWSERTELFGEDFTLRLEWPDRVTLWEQGKLVLEETPAADEPGFVGDGTYHETLAFIDALEANTPLNPTPADVLPSMLLCQ